MRHTVTIDDFCDIPFICKHEIASSYGGGHRKSLKVIADIKSLKVSFEVFDGLTKVSCYTLENSIKLYNELP